MTVNHFGKNSVAKTLPQKKKSLPVKTLSIIGVALGILGIGAFFLIPEEKIEVPATVEKPKKKVVKKPEPVVRTAKPKPVAEPQTNRAVRIAKNGTKINIPKSPFSTPVPKDLEYKPIWEYTPEDFARIDPTYAKRHERFLEMKEKRIWKTHADNQLALLCFTPPDGNSLLIPFSPRFKDQFLKSLETPIIVHEDDSPEVAQQKRDLIETKAFLKEKIDAGEDIVKLLNEEYDRQTKIRGLYRNLERELKSLQRTAKSVEEMEDFVTAANVMLENAGGGKIKIPLLALKYRLKREAAKAANK